MFAIDFIDKDLPAVDISDNVKLALQYIHEEKLSHVVVLDKEIVIGIVEEELLHNFDTATPLSRIPVKYDAKTAVSQGMHFLELADYLINQDLEICPIIDHKNNYLGCIRALDVFKKVLKGQFSGSGGLFSLNIDQKDYSLSDISRIIETEGMRIEKLYLAQENQSEYHFVFKLNKKEIDSALNSLQRFGYRVERISETEPNSFPDKERFDHLMKYLEI